MKRLPLVAMLLVGLACATMIGLGIWQLRRAEWKDALIVRYAANRTQAGDIMLPPMPPVPETALFRRTRAQCLRVAEWRTRNGMAADGSRGFRHIAVCSTGVEGPGFLVDIGVSARPDFKPAWPGGDVAGIISLDPDGPGALARLIRTPPPPRAMIVATTPAPGLKASAPPGTEAIPNNHRSYAIQWFSFSAIAAVIFGIAFARRRRATQATPQ